MGCGLINTKMTIKLLYFQADWCDPCDSQDPVIDNLTQEIDESINLQIEEIDIDDDNRFQQEFNIISIPTVLVGISKEEELVEHRRFIGITKSEKIEEAISSASKQVEN